MQKNGRPDREADERVGEQRRVAGRERTALQARDDDRPRERDRHCGGGDDHGQGEAQRAREPVTQRRRVAASAGAASSGATAVMIGYANKPYGSWKKMYAVR